MSDKKDFSWIGIPFAIGAFFVGMWGMFFILEFGFTEPAKVLRLHNQSLWVLTEGEFGVWGDGREKSRIFDPNEGGLALSDEVIEWIKTDTIKQLIEITK